jgi:nitroreductase
MDAYQALVTRASALELCDPGPDEETERKLIAAALRAPDHGRLRPWRFISIKGGSRDHFAEILVQSLLRKEAHATPESVARERQKAFRAPLILVAAARIVDSPKIPAVEQVLSAAAAAQNIMLASHALGFAAMWKTGEAAYDPAVKEALGLRASDAIVGFLYVGTPKAMPKTQPALDPLDFVRDYPPQKKS